MARTAFRDGTRVMLVGVFASIHYGIPCGTLGTVVNPKQSFLQGRGFTYVDWDSPYASIGVFTREVVRVSKSAELALRELGTWRGGYEPCEGTPSAKRMQALWDAGLCAMVGSKFYTWQNAKLEGVL